MSMSTSVESLVVYASKKYYILINPQRIDTCMSRDTNPFLLVQAGKCCKVE